MIIKEKYMKNMLKFNPIKLRIKTADSLKPRVSKHNETLITEEELRLSVFHQKLEDDELYEK